MEVPQSQYWRRLLSILNHIADAKFVAFDLEMSGIAARSRFGQNSKGQGGGKPSLQALYDEVRVAAELYQVLQIGITCVEENREKDYYLVRPYNFDVSPLLYHENRVKDRFSERKIVFSSSAADFLQNQAGFDIGKVFREGVYYLSYTDEEETREHLSVRMDREKSKAEAMVQPGDEDTKKFIRYVRKTLSEWATADKPDYGFVNIGDPSGGDLNGYQRLLIHQLVQNEYPGYRSFPRGNQSFIQVEKINVKKEAQYQAKKLNDFNDALAKQIGLRWIFEALTGGDFKGFRTNLLANEYSDNPELSQIAIENKFREVKLKLKNKEHVLVGHNLFTDLAYVYKTFVGPLPLKVEDFQHRIHGLFPIVFDTKYIVTLGQSSMSTVMRKNLEELLEPFKRIHTTRFMLDEEHISYDTSRGKKHEAGFDSFMTAHLFAKLVASLHAQRKLTENFNRADDEVSLPSHSSESQPYLTADECSNPSQPASDDNLDGGAKLSPQTQEGDLLGLLDETTTHGEGSAQLTGDKFSTAFGKAINRHDTIMDDTLPSGWHADQLQRLSLNDSNPYAVLATIGDGHRNGAGSAAVDVQQWIPAMDSTFWDIYINKLRVNASEGGVCYLNR